jgi:hypothetical protein
MCNDREKHGGTRRSFLRAAGLAGAGAAALGAGALGAADLADPQPALAAVSNESLGQGRWNPDTVPHAERALLATRSHGADQRRGQ